MFEALHLPGGVLSYGIPEFRLPKQIVKSEVEYVVKLGVDLKCNWMIGRTLTVDELFEQGYDAIFIGSGAGLPTFLKIPGENLNGVYSANEFLTRINLMKAYLFPEQDTPVKKPRNAVIVGAGNVAMDAARSAIRLGAEKAYVVYRRTEEEMPARKEEVDHAKEEGIDFRLLSNPVRIIDNGQGWVSGIEVMEMELGEPDASGRRRPVPKPGTEYVIDCDTVIVAVGTNANPVIVQTTEGLEASHHGTVVADPQTGATSRKGVWAGGDIVTGAATVISAMGAGKRAAADIHAVLNGVK
jgi:glutamate synthase (NADPH/NADH) small chain